MPVTERLILPVKGGVEEWKDGLKFLLQTLKVQEGYIRTRWGPHSENQQKLELLIGWESTAAQVKFQAGSDFASVMSQLKPLLSGPTTAYFIEFKPYAPKEVIDAPFVEMLTIMGASGSKDQLRTAVESYKGSDGCTGAASGFSLSEVDGKGKAFVGVIGWNSLEESKKARGSKILDVDGTTEVHHVDFRFPIKGFRGL